MTKWIKCLWSGLTGTTYEKENKAAINRKLSRLSSILDGYGDRFTHDYLDQQIEALEID